VYGFGDISSLHGIALSAWAFAGLTGNQIADLIVNKTGNYQNILIFTVIMYAIALVVDLLFVHAKHVEPKEKAKQE
jgi:OFA family oxalate/formate antiporter-like MFS transporter